MKKHSRVVRKIAMTLAAWNVPTVFRSPIFSNGTEEWKEVHLADIIERALQNETIKKRELDALRAKADLVEKREKQIRALQEDVAWWCQRALSYGCELAKEKADHQFTLKEHDKQRAHANKFLQENINLRYDNLILRMTQIPAYEPIEIPRCLNTKDAQTWTHTYIHGRCL